MAIVWITYSWEDNKAGDVDFAAQELSTSGLTIKLDRWNLKAGERLWNQIGDIISNPDLSDAWLLYAPQSSLGSEACKEEFAYALDRALHTRGEEFPVLALFPASVDRDLIPAGIRTRLYVSLTDPDWKERIRAAAERRDISIAHPKILPYELTVHNVEVGNRKFLIEVRPRAGTWSPFVAGIPIEEKDIVMPSPRRGPKGRIPTGGYTTTEAGGGVSKDGRWWFEFSVAEATPTQSYFIYCNELPSTFIFGVDGGPLYRKDFHEGPFTNVQL